MAIPAFKYHPDPIATGSIKPSSAMCDCCGQPRGFAYTASFYTAHKPKPTLCPWCIASGEAAKRYEGQFSDDHPLHEASLDERVVQEVCERTPGYSSWQQEVWQSHCGDACEFHGDVSADELRALDRATLAAALDYKGEDEARLTSFVKNYEPGGNPAVYKFVCRQCRERVYCLDFT